MRAVPGKFAGALLGLCFSGCAAAQPADEPVRSLLEMRQHGVVMQQWDFSCGAAALATVLSFGLGDPVSEARVLDGLARLSDPDAVHRGGGLSMLDLIENYLIHDNR